MRDINKELEKFYSLLETLDDDDANSNEVKQKSLPRRQSAGDTSSDNPRPTPKHRPRRNAEDSASIPGVYAGNASYGWPSKVIDSARDSARDSAAARNRVRVHPSVSSSLDSPVAPLETRSSEARHTSAPDHRPDPRPSDQSPSIEQIQPPAVQANEIFFGNEPARLPYDEAKETASPERVDRPAFRSENRPTPWPVRKAEKAQLLGKVKLPTVNAEAPAKDGRRDIDSVITDIRQTLNKRSNDRSIERDNRIDRNRLDDDVASPIVDLYTGEPKKKVYAPAIEPPIQEAIATVRRFRSARFVMATAVVALVVPAVLAGMLLVRMNLGPDNRQIASATTLSSEDGEPTLTVNTEPAGARVFLNNQLIGVTPFQSVKVPPGDYLLTTEKEGFFQSDTVISIRGTQRLAVALGALDGFDSIQPEQATDGHILAGLEAENDGSEVGAAVPEVRSDNERNQDSANTSSRDSERESTGRSSATENRNRRSNASARRTGGVVITSNPEGATVWVDGEDSGETPLTIKGLSVGARDIQFTKGGYESFSTSLDVSSDIVTPLHAELIAYTGTVAVTVEPAGVLYIDDELLSNNIVGLETFDLTPGAHTVRVVNSEFGTRELAVDIQAGRVAEVSVDFLQAGFVAVVQEAEKFFERGEYAAARELFKKAAGMQPGNTRVTGKLAEIDRLLTSEQEQELNEAIVEDGVYLVVDKAPELVGGLEEIHKNVKYPTAAHRAGISGRVYVQFVVDENGNPSDFKVTRGLPLGCNEAAIDAIRQAKFTAGEFRGRKVKTRHTLFINFKSK